ncbi:dCTP deaminase [Fibrella aquatica]|uniref:dCTP deaminase n=1 Tax=Fibrella aquatica TaxID=3242487 RepID=UPI00351FBBB1
MEEKPVVATEPIDKALTGSLIKSRLDRDLFIRPLLDPEKQINEASVDFRLGYDFMVNVPSRDAYINASLNSLGAPNTRDLKQFFQETRRQLGETFVLHPHQTVLATSIEYIKLPEDLFVMLFMRSSYSRLGLSISTILQPGYCGCISLELTNNNFTPINLTVGARLFQGVFMPTASPVSYFGRQRKYMCQVRPEVSAANQDNDLETLNKLWKSENHLR